MVEVISLSKFCGHIRHSVEGVRVLRSGGAVVKSKANSARPRATLRLASASCRSISRGQIQTGWDSSAQPVPTSLSLQAYASCERGMKNPSAPWRRGRCSRTLPTRSSHSAPRNARRRLLLLLSDDSPSPRYGTTSLFLSLRSGVSLPVSLRSGVSLPPCLSPLRRLSPSLSLSAPASLSLSLSARASSLSPCLSLLRRLSPYLSPLRPSSLSPCLSPLRSPPSLPVSLCSGAHLQVAPARSWAIISSSLDSNRGARLLHPFLSRGFRVAAVSSNVAHSRLGQNLSNLLRLMLFCKFGRIYLDTDVIVMKSFSGLRNAIGAQMIDGAGRHGSLPVSLLSGLLPLSLSLSAPASSLSHCLSPLRPPPSLHLQMRLSLSPVSPSPLALLPLSPFPHLLRPPSFLSLHVSPSPSSLAPAGTHCSYMLGNPNIYLFQSI
ncbi:hypothetical protein ACLOJK_041627 [Asimina triloba]